MKKTIVWFRQDLRLSDNPALLAAANAGQILPVYIWDEKAAGEFKPGAASRWWLQKSLLDLHESLQGHLQVYSGDALGVLTKLIREHEINAVYWNRCYEPWRIRQDSRIKTQLKEKQIECESFNASLLFEPWEILKLDRTFYRVFTPYYRTVLSEKKRIREPLGKPKKLSFCSDKSTPASTEPVQDWHVKLENHWKVGEKAALKRLQDFQEDDLESYAKTRDIPSLESTSRLSPYLHFGEISPQQIWSAVYSQSEKFLQELIWREFSYYLLYHFPELPSKNFQSRFDGFEWRTDSDLLRKWQRGETGYALVDAGMKELWETGTMHNRVRMVVASFLVKNLKIDWREGARWFWDCLVDADLASNSASWQWVAGSGVDAAPYFRIFNPMTQAKKFDPENDYVTKWVKRVSEPVVDFKTSREQALDAYRAL